MVGLGLLLSLVSCVSISLPVSGSRVEGKTIEKRDSKCSPPSSQRAVAYYESWASTRSCNVFKPSDIDATQWTHINFAFAELSHSGEIKASSHHDPGIYNETTALKDQNKDLEVWIAVGGDGVGSKPFSNMVSDKKSRKGFIDSANEFMDKYGFDGIDIDWEYPAATDLGGRKSDRENLAELVKEMKESFGGKKGISMTVPAREYYLKGFDLESMQEDLDMVNFMSYDLHGSWDKPLLAQPGTNLTEINTALEELLQQKSIPAHKINLGLAYYGYSYILEDESCSKPGCPAKSVGKAGPCSKSKGTLYDSEIENIIDQKNPKQHVDKDAAIAYFTYDDKNWVAYDNNETLQLKTDYARENCLGGSLVWSVDMENPKEKMDPKISGSCPKSVVPWAVLGLSFLCSFFFVV